MSTLPARRRRPSAAFAVILLALLATGAAYALLRPAPTEAAVTAPTQSPVEEGRDLFLANCSSCHGINGEGSTDGPSLVGVGAAAVDFQVGTGRMPAYTSDAQQIPEAKTVFTQREIDQLGAYVASLGPGPAIPSEDLYATQEVSAEELGEGGELFRVNCAMCHNVQLSGGALTRGKYAPALFTVAPKHIYEAMITGPQSMPVFGETLTPEQKKYIIAYIQRLQEQPSYGGWSLGRVGPVSEGLFVWIVGIGALAGVAVWLGAKSS